jgi:hypothetical protein
MFKLSRCKQISTSQGSYQALTTGVIVSLAYILTAIIPELSSSHLLVMSILLGQIDSGVTIKDYTWRQLLSYYVLTVGVITVIVSSCSYCAAVAPIAGILWLGLITGGATYFSYTQRQYWPAGIIINLFAIMATVSAAQQLWPLTLLAGCLMLVVRLPLRYYYQRHKAAYYWRQLWQQFSKLYHLIFTLNTDSQSWQLALSHSLAALNNCKHFATYPNLLQIWQLSLRLSALRYRLSDTALLASKPQLLSDINQALQQVIADLANAAKDSSLSLQLLNTKVADLAQFYQHIVKFATTNPETLLLFINDLNELSPQLATLQRPTQHTRITPSTISMTTTSRPPANLLWYRILRSIITVVSAILLGKTAYPLAILPVTVMTMLLNYASILPLPQIFRCVIGCTALGFLQQVLSTALPFYLGQAILLIVIIVLAYQLTTKLQTAYIESAISPLALLSCSAICLLSNSNHYNLTASALALGWLIVIIGPLLGYPDRKAQSFSKNASALLQQLAANSRQIGQMFTINPSNTIDQASSITTTIHHIWLDHDSCFPHWVFVAGYNPALQPSQQYFANRLWYLSEIQLGILPLIQATASLAQEAKLLLLKFQQHSEQILKQLSLPLQHLTSVASEQPLALLPNNTELNNDLAAIAATLPVDDFELLRLLRYLQDSCQQLQQLQATIH